MKKKNPRTHFGALTLPFEGVLSLSGSMFECTMTKFQAIANEAY